MLTELIGILENGRMLQIGVVQQWAGPSIDMNVQTLLGLKAELSNWPNWGLREAVKTGHGGASLTHTSNKSSVPIFPHQNAQGHFDFI